MFRFAHTHKFAFLTAIMTSLLFTSCKLEDEKGKGVTSQRGTMVGSGNQVQDMNRISGLAQAITSNDPAVFGNPDKQKEDLQRALDEVPELGPKVSELYQAVLNQNPYYSASHSPASVRSAAASDVVNPNPRGCVNPVAPPPGNGGPAVCPNVCVFAAAFAAAAACAHAEAYACASCTNADGTSNSVCAWARSNACAYAFGFGFAYACTGGGPPANGGAGGNEPNVCPVPDDGPLPMPTMTPTPTPTSTSIPTASPAP